MRSICWVPAVLLICGLVSPVLGLQPIIEANGTTAEGGAWGPAAAPPCGVWCFGMMPGCCQCPPSCCDDAWDGYCEQKGCLGWGLRSGVCRGTASSCPPRMGRRQGVFRWSQPMTDGAVASPESQGLDPQPLEPPAQTPTPAVPEETR